MIKKKKYTKKHKRGRLGLKLDRVQGRECQVFAVIRKKKKRKKNKGYTSTIEQNILPKRK